MDNEQIELQLELTKEFWSDTTILPLFINNNNISHNKCREEVKEIFNVLIYLLEPRVLTKRATNKIILKVDEILDVVIDIEPSIGILYYNYIREFITYYKTKSIELELYEITTNITNFLDYYKYNSME